MDQNNNLNNEYYMDTTGVLVDCILESFENEKWNKKDVSKNVKNIIEEYCKNNRLSDHGIEEVVGHIVTVLDKTMDEYVNFFVEQYYQNVFKSQINPIGTKEKSSVHYKKYKTIQIIQKRGFTESVNAIKIDFDKQTNNFNEQEKACSDI